MRRRDLVPPEKVNASFDIKPETCRCCRIALLGEDLEPLRHQVAELPPIEPVVKLLKQESSLWTFVWTEGIEPTNNDAERVLRHAVLWRKSSGGTDSKAGSRPRRTNPQRRGNVLELLTACCRARLDGADTPSLLRAEAELAAA